MNALRFFFIESNEFESLRLHFDNALVISALCVLEKAEIVIMTEL